MKDSGKTAKSVEGFGETLGSSFLFLPDESHKGEATQHEYQISSEYLIYVGNKSTRMNEFCILNRNMKHTEG